MDQFISQGRIIVIMLGIIWFKNCLIVKNNENITQAEKNSLLIQNIGCCILILTYIAFELLVIMDSIL